MMVRRMSDHTTPADGCLIQDSSSIAKESGEALKALLDAQQSNSADEKAQAITEVDEAIFALRQARTRLEASVTRAPQEEET